VRAYHVIRDGLAEAVPEWPLGLPGWDDGWLALALRTPSVTYLGLWRRPGAAPTVTLPIGAAGIDLLFPRHLPAWELRPAKELTVTSTSLEPYAARIFRIYHAKGQR
jgi:alpha-galactosidase